MAIHHVMRQPQGNAEFTDLVLEQFAQWLEQLQAKRLGQATNVVVTFDGMRLLVLGATRFDYIGVDRPLGQPLCPGQLLRFGLKHLHELATDDLALLLRIRHTLEVAEELFRRVDMNNLRMQPSREHLHDHLAFIQPQQAVIDKYAGQLVADGAMDECCSDRRIDAAGKAQNDLFVTHLLTNAFDGFSDIVGHIPVMTTTADVVHEATDHLLALDRVRNLWVELNAIETTIFIRHRSNRC